MVLINQILKNYFKKINDKILINYLSYDIFKINKYIKISFINLLGKFQKSDLEKLYWNQPKINFRFRKCKEKLETNNGEIPNSLMNTYPAKLNLIMSHIK